MTDARLGGLGREALVSDTGQGRLVGLAREALVSGIGLAGTTGGRSGSRAALSVIFAGVVRSASAQARSYTKVARPTLLINLAGRSAAGSSVKVQRTTTVSLSGRVQARSRG